MNNEKLIEEAAKAIRDLDAAFDFNNGDNPHDRYDALIQGFARAALAVFEKALGEATVTPTDADEVISERQALRIAELDARQAAYRKEREDWFVDHEAEPEIASNAFFRGWDAAVDGGFRLSEVPEPSAKGLSVCIVCGREVVLLGPEGRHGWHHRNGLDISRSDYHRAAVHLVNPEVAKSQGEPSDAQELLDEADALIDVWDRKGSWTPDSPIGLVMRLAAALRAAWGVR